MIDEGVRRAYLLPDNKLRASIVADPAFTRKNTRDNSPAVVHVEMVPGDHVEVIVSAKGGGSENKSKFVMLNPSDSIVDWVLKTVPTMGAGWCPPGMLGIGIGGTPEKAMLLAKEVVDGTASTWPNSRRAVPRTPVEELRIELYDKVNALGIGAQGLGGLVDRARRQDPRLPDARRLETGGDDLRTAPRLGTYISRSTAPARRELDAASTSPDWPKVDLEAVRQSRSASISTR
jgi:hypothetical protein